MEALDRLQEATKWMWSLGDYPAVAALLEPAAHKLAAACALRPGVRMLELGRARTGAAVEWREGDAEALPFPDESFDVVASVFGAMFAPRPDRVASAMFRVCRTGGVVAMANYSWAGFLGDYAKLLARYSNPSPVPLPSPFEWGDPAILEARLGPYASSLEVREETLAMRADFDFWERTNAPTIALRQAMPPDRYAAFRREAEALMDGRELVSSYVLVVARK